MLFLRAHAWQWGLAYALCALILYSRPIFNFSSLLPLLLVTIALPFSAYPASFFFQAAFSGIIAGVFVTIVSAKNFILTNRDVWVQCVAYFLAYLSLLSFFASRPAGSFIFSWLLALILILFILTVAFRDVRTAFPAACVMGELIWVASWLPIGFLSLANFSFLGLIFLGDTLHQGRVSVRRAFLFFTLAGLIAASSYWRI